MTKQESQESEPTLARRLGLTSAVMVVIGSVVGSGIFLTPQSIAATVQIPGIMIFVWILTGLLTLAGALTNAEIAGMIPEAGGQYVFFRVTYGDLTAFLYGWTTFIVYQTGSIAAIAVAFARYFGYFVDLPHLSPALEAWKLPLIGNIYPLKDIGVSLVAISSILLLAGVNYFGVQIGGFVQDIFTFLKILAIGGIIVLAFTVGHGSTAHFFPLWGMPASGALLSAIGVAMIATLWSYDGWNSLTYLAGEVKEPKKNIPLALVLGTVIIILIYVATNLAYLFILPIGEIATSKLVAADVMERIFHGYGGAIISAMVMISTFGTVNATSMTTARVYFAMAKDKLFFRSLGKIHPKYRTPGTSLLVQGVWASILTLTGNLRPDLHVRHFCRMDLLCAGSLGSVCVEEENAGHSPPVQGAGISVYPDSIYHRCNVVCVQHDRAANGRFHGGIIFAAGRNPVLSLLEQANQEIEGVNIRGLIRN